jgi:hypothetical protein
LHLLHVHDLRTNATKQEKDLRGTQAAADRAMEEISEIELCRRNSKIELCRRNSKIESCWLKTIFFAMINDIDSKVFLSAYHPEC